MKLPIFNRYAKRQIQDLLITHADALIAGVFDQDKLLEPYNAVIQEQVRGLTVLAERISHSLIEVTPSEQFVAQLRLQLLETPLHRGSWWWRIRRLPPRTQIAAGIGGATLTAGVVLIASRSMPNALEYWRNLREIVTEI